MTLIPQASTKSTLLKPALIYQTDSRKTLQDCLFLTFIAVLSFILYIGAIGFYADDWAIFGAFSNSADQTVAGFYRSFNSPLVWMRPIQTLYMACLYRMFGLNPLGYHVVNNFVFVLGLVLFYLVLRELGQPRVLRLSVPMVYGLLPHYSTDRIWFVLFVGNLCMALYFVSLYSDLRSLTAQRLKFWRWKLLSIMSILGSCLAYEVFLPLFFLNAFFVWRQNKKLNQSDSESSSSNLKLAFIISSNLAIVFLILLFKWITTTRLGEQTLAGHLAWLVYFSKEAVKVSYLSYGLALPARLVTIAQNYSIWRNWMLGAFTGIAIFAYFYRLIARSGEAELPGRSAMLKLAGWGVIVFAFGYAVFLTNENARNALTGIDNRVAIAGTLGVALSMVGIAGWLCDVQRPGRWRFTLFSFVIAFICFCGFMIINTIATFWVTAYTKEQQVLSEIHHQIPTLPTGSSLILDGVCPYVGPAVVFESNWDLAGAIQVIYHDRSLRADIVKPSLMITAEGLRTFIYGDESVYPYDELLIYNFKKRISRSLPDASSARSYFETFNPYFGIECPQGEEGFGVPIF